MKKSDIRELPEYYDYYILLNYDIELNDAFERSIKEINTLDVDRLKRIGLRTYAEGNGQRTQSSSTSQTGSVSGVTDYFCLSEMRALYRRDSITILWQTMPMPTTYPSTNYSMSYVQCGWRRKGCSITLTNGFSGQTANSIRRRCRFWPWGLIFSDTRYIISTSSGKGICRWRINTGLIIGLHYLREQMPSKMR